MCLELRNTRRDRLSPVYRDLWSRTMMKGRIDTQWVATPTRQRLATSRKRALRSRSVRAARSVCSEYRSRVIEPRKFDNRWGLPDRVRGDSIARAAKAMARVTRPGSESVAEVYGGIPGTCEGLPLPVDKQSRNGMKPSEQRPGLREVFPSLAATKHRKASGNRCPSSRQGCRDGVSGRLSRLIVAIESRVTLLGRSL
jgi:hypothetical protein